MKKILLILIAISCFKIAGAQIPVSKTDTGIIDGAAYKIVFPPNWKGKLVMYAHGYEFMGSSPRQSNDPRFVNGL